MWIRELSTIKGISLDDYQHPNTCQLLRTDGDKGGIQELSKMPKSKKKLCFIITWDLCTQKEANAFSV
jgi:hypothetical protein